MTRQPFKTHPLAGPTCECMECESDRQAAAPSPEAPPPLPEGYVAARDAFEEEARSDHGNGVAFRERDALDAAITSALSAAREEGRREGIEEAAREVPNVYDGNEDSYHNIPKIQAGIRALGAKRGE